ncbi:uncharacterized protein [Panulirus ornatus]|uniref:uncharacterized protein isoform X2 n=1 Tax=Panulirus ornatus TaxID=150431 RepID=UPI003A8882FC
MPRPLTQSALMRPFVALALPGMYLVYKYNQYKRQQQEANRRKAAERELAQLNHKIEKLLNKLDEHEPELAMTQEEECVICVNAKATMQTFPCGHRVVCRKCFVKTIQVAVSQRLLPLRCVVCRAKILRLRQARDAPFPTSVSQYSMAAVAASARCMPNSSSLYSFGSGSSGISGLSNVSSASSSSGGSYRSEGRVKLGRPVAVYTAKRLPPGKKVSSKSGARSKEPLQPGPPQIRIDEYHEPPCRHPPNSRPPRVHIRENKVAPQEALGRLPTIKEYTEFINEKELEEKSSSTRIRCAQKLVSQIEHHHGVLPRAVHSPTGSSSSPSPSPARSPTAMAVATAATAAAAAAGGSGASLNTLHARAMSRSPSTSPSGTSSTRSTPDKKNFSGMGRRESSTSTTSLKSNLSRASTSSVRSSASTHSSASYKSASSVKSTSSSVKSGMSSKSSASTRSTASTKSNASAKSTNTVKSAKLTGSKKKDHEGKGVRRKEVNDKKSENTDKRVKSSKGESKMKALKKRFEGKEYQRLQ